MPELTGYAKILIQIYFILILAPFSEKTMHNLTGYATPSTTAACFLLSVFELSAELF